MGSGSARQAPAELPAESPARHGPATDTRGASLDPLAYRGPGRDQAPARRRPGDRFATAAVLPIKVDPIYHYGVPEGEKTVAWHSDARNLERQRIPREFTTRSCAVIISNDWQTLNKNVAALQDRGHVLLFQPTAAEVHARAGTWFDDQEIYAWFA